MSDKEDTLKLLSLAATVAALAFTGTASAAQIIPIPMHDPGCHVFYVHGKYVKSVTVKGATTFVNQDENTLIFKGPGGTKYVKVGKALTLRSTGVYHVTMLNQAPDDNHLTLTVKK